MKKGRAQSLVGIVSPDPSSDGGGVERFCHLVAAALNEGDIPSVVVGPEDVTDRRYSLLITNGPHSAPRGIPRIHVYHGCWPSHVWASAEGSWHWRVRRSAGGAVEERRAGLHATRVTVSWQSASEIRRWYGLRDVHVISNGVDCELFAPSDKTSARRRLGIPTGVRMALFVGRAEQRKRPDWALRSAQTLGMQLYFAGQGHIAGSTSLGLIGRRQLADAYSAADLVLAPTAYEGCSFAILEALAAGAPLVTTRVGWMRDLTSQLDSARFVSSTNTYGDFLQAASEVSNGDANRDLSKASHAVRSNNNIQRFASDWCSLVSAELAFRGLTTGQA